MNEYDLSHLHLIASTITSELYEPMTIQNKSQFLRIAIIRTFIHLLCSVFWNGWHSSFEQTLSGCKYVVVLTAWRSLRDAAWTWIVQTGTSAPMASRELGVSEDPSVSTSSTVRRHVLWYNNYLLSFPNREHLFAALSVHPSVCPCFHALFGTSSWNYKSYQHNTCR